VGSYLGNALLLRCHYHTLKVVGLSFAKFKSNVFWLTNFVIVLTPKNWESFVFQSVNSTNFAIVVETFAKIVIN
jgi:hypothetical protein